jgi:hypothetical protein
MVVSCLMLGTQKKKNDEDGLYGSKVIPASNYGYQVKVSNLDRDKYRV